MSDKNTGGPAFPCLEATMTGIDSDGNERFDTESHGGMTLRDYFAAKAMAAYIVGVMSGGMTPEVSSIARKLGMSSEQYTAKKAFDQADAMIAARNA